MNSTKVNAFFSCSFAEEDRHVVSFFRKIAEALTFECINLSLGYAEIPPIKAKELIQNARVLIAVATRRDVIANSNDYLMPRSVRDEAAFAYDAGRPILLFIEEGIKVDGFLNNFCTFLPFRRDKLVSDLDFLEKAVASMHDFKLNVIEKRELTLEQIGIDMFYADFYKQLIVLEKENGEYIWKYTSTKKITFNQKCDIALKTGAWLALTNIDGTNQPNMGWNFVNDGGSRHFEDKVVVEKIGFDHVELAIYLDPIPEKDDFFQYTVSYKSKFLNPVFEEDVINDSAIVINGKKYSCCDGIVPIQRTRSGRVQYRFPKEYGLCENDFIPIVGSCSSKLDYVLENEISRMQIKKESFGGDLLIDLYIDGPVLNHIYGLLWNPPPKPNSGQL